MLMAKTMWTLEDAMRSSSLGEAALGQARPTGLRRELAALALLMGLCIALRVVQLRALPVFIDESVYARAAQIVGARPGPATIFIQEAPNFGFNPPLFSWLAAPLTRLVADPL